MGDISIQRIQISGPILSSIIQRVSFSVGDVDGLLFGTISNNTTPNLTDDEPTTSSQTLTLIATITSFFCSTSTTTFYDASGHINLNSLNSLIADKSQTLIGWFSGRRRTSLRPSMRETSVSYSLSNQILFSSQVQNSPNSYTARPSIFLLLTTPFQDQSVYTYEYRTYQYRVFADLFDPKTLDVVNIGPAFRGHYDSFSPSSQFPLLPCEFRGLSSTSMVEDRNEKESLKDLRRASNDQKDLDLYAESFEIRRLKGLTGSHTAHYTTELEDLYSKMLTKLNGLARLVEKTSASVLEQENHNLKLRYKYAGLE